MSKVSGFGTTHIDRPSKVKTELTEFCENVDVFFVESPKDEPSSIDERNLILRNPIMWVTGWIVDFVWGVPGFILTGSPRPVDGYVTDAISEEQDIPIEPVDMNLMERAGEVPFWLTVLSWISVLVAISIFVLGIMATSLKLVLGSFIIGFAPAALFAVLTKSERDMEMAENIDQFLANHEDVESACLIAGKKHIPGVVDQLKKRGVDVQKVHKSKFFRKSL